LLQEASQGELWECVHDVDEGEGGVLKKFRIVLPILFLLVMVNVLSAWNKDRMNDLSVLNSKVDKLEQIIDEMLKTDSSALILYAKEIEIMQRKQKIQYLFMEQQFDKWQKYYIEHWKG
jgi:hypothetical protein